MVAFFAVEGALDQRRTAVFQGHDPEAVMGADLRIRIVIPSGVPPTLFVKTWGFDAPTKHSNANQRHTMTTNALLKAAGTPRCFSQTAARGLSTTYRNVTLESLTFKQNGS